MMKETSLTKVHRDSGAARVAASFNRWISLDRQGLGAARVIAGALFGLGCGDPGDARGGTATPEDASLATESGPTGDASDTAGETGHSEQTGDASETAGAEDPSGSQPLRETFYVEGRFLHDGCGEKVVLRGVNEMIVWSPQRDGLPEFVEIARTGANAVRIVWNEEGSADDLDRAITNSIENQLIPMVEHHSATGDLSLVPTVVDDWTQPDVVAVLQKHARYLLLNIANEAGDADVEEGEFQLTYESAISRIRETGIQVPLIIDAPTWGQDIDMLQAVGPSLLEFDPLHNTMFSVHMWWTDATGDRVRRELQESADMGLPLLVGEFADHAVHLCDESPFDYGTLLDEAQRLEIGWLAWSWGGVQNNDCMDAGPFDMTVDGTFGEWKTDWGREVAVDHPNSIQNTSVRPHSIVNGSCQ